jgi:hypothetical protein
MKTFSTETQIAARSQTNSLNYLRHVTATTNGFPKLFTSNLCRAPLLHPRYKFNGSMGFGIINFLHNKFFMEFGRSNLSDNCVSLPAPLHTQTHLFSHP